MLSHGHPGIKISIHAPLTGSDLFPPFGGLEQMISIHAPLTGSDWNHPAGHRWWKYFNPRSPYGERQG